LYALIVCALALSALAACDVPFGLGGASGQPPAPTPLPAAKASPNAAAKPQGTTGRTAQVEQADFALSVSYSGNLNAPQQVSLTPRLLGPVVKLYVDVGAVVKQGDPIAEIDHASLDAQLTQAKARLDQVKQGGRPESIAQAQSNLDSANARLQTIKNGPRPEDVAAAKSNADAAQAKLDSMRQGGRTEDVRTAQAAVDIAQAKLQTMLNGPRPQDVAVAQAAVDTAQAKLQTILNGPRPQDVATAQAALDQANQKLQALKNGVRPEQVAVLQQAVQQAKNALFAAQSNRDAACNPKNPKPVCDVAQAQVDTAQSALDTANAQYALATAPALATDIQQAEAAVNSAQQALDKAKNPYTQQDLQQAQAAVASAQQALDKVKQPYTAQDIAQAQAAVVQAQQALVEARQPFTAQDIQAQQDAVTAANQVLAKASAPYTDQDLAQAQAAVASAEQGLALAKAPFTDQDVAQAQATYDIAKVARDTAFVNAPFDGTITQRLVSEGATVTTNTPIVTLVGKQIQVDLNVAESDVAQFKAGQQATMKVAAYPSETFPATVKLVTPAVDPKSRTFDVVITPAKEDSRLVAGMFAEVTVATVSHPNTLLVPSTAVTVRNNKPVVFLVTGSTVKMQPVTTGLTDNVKTEITQGVSAGQTVVSTGVTALNDGDSLTGGAPAAGGGQNPASGTPGAPAKQSGQATPARTP
jgi:HlyD family secretion protein